MDKHKIRYDFRCLLKNMLRSELHSSFIWMKYEIKNHCNRILYHINEKHEIDNDLIEKEFNEILLRHQESMIDRLSFHFSETKEIGDDFNP